MLTHYIITFNTLEQRRSCFKYYINGSSVMHIRLAAAFLANHFACLKGFS